MNGTCNCGAIAFTISGKLPAMYQCHCSLCQKQSGTGSNAATIVYSEAFEWVRGVGSIKQWKKETGFNSHFCTICGSPVPNSLGSKYVWIPVGLLEQVDSKVVAHLFLDSKPSWERTIKTLREYEGMPEDIDEFVVFLHQENRAS